LGRGEFSPCSPWRPPLNTWASKIGPRELKFGGRYVCQVPNIRIFENSNIAQCRAKPNIQIRGVPIAPILADGRRMLKGHKVPPDVKIKSQRSRPKPRIQAQDFRRSVCM
ncbi:unnamed protein product, partial [Prunus brigantina]